MLANTDATGRRQQLKPDPERSKEVTELLAGSADQLVTYRMGLWHQRSVRRYREQMGAGKRAAPSTDEETTLN